MLLLYKKKNIEYINADAEDGKVKQLNASFTIQKKN